jgi:hypothetical protein
MVRKLLMAVVAFRTTIPNRSSIITMFGLPDKRSATVFDLAPEEKTIHFPLMSHEHEVRQNYSAAYNTK